MRNLIDLLSEDTEFGRREFYRDLISHRSEKFGSPSSDIAVSQWPPSSQELREIERKVLQDPEWLQYWAHFGWRSFTSTTNWWYDKHNSEFVFYDVPEVSYFNDTLAPDHNMVKMDIDGVVTSKKSQYSHLRVTLPSALAVCRDVVAKARPKLRFLQGRYYIRFGMWPKDERSRNWLIKDEEVYEKGVSAYHADYDLDDDRWAIDPSVHEDAIGGTLQSLIYGNKPVYLVQGDEIDEEGADGEPLLHNVKLIAQLDRNSVYVPGIFDPREDL